MKHENFVSNKFLFHKTLTIITILTKTYITYNTTPNY